MSREIKESKWITGNNDGTTVFASIAISHITDLVAQVQHGWGIVNCRVGGGNVESGWSTDNFRGKEESHKIAGSPTKFLVKEQLNYGIVDFGVEVNGTTHWIANNQEGDVKSFAFPSGSEFVGIQAKEQDRFGIVDLRVFYMDKA